MDYLRSSKKAVHKSVRLCMDTDLREELEEARRALSAAETRSRGLRGEASETALANAQERVSDLEQQVRESSVKFLFKSLGRKRMDTLVGEHPPTPEQKAQGTTERPVEFNPDTFPQVLVAACIVEPELTQEDVDELWIDDRWSDLDLAALFNTALMANQTNSVVRLGNG